MGGCVSRGSPIVPKEDVNYCSVELEVYGTLLLPETFANEYTIVPDDLNDPFLLGHGSFSSGMCVVVFSLLSITVVDFLFAFAFASLQPSSPLHHCINRCYCRCYCRYYCRCYCRCYWRCYWRCHCRCHCRCYCRRFKLNRFRKAKR